MNKKYKTKVSVREVDQWLEELDEWSSEFEGVMEEWGENFGKEFEMNFGPEFEEKMEKWGEEFGKNMEEWGENFGEKLEEKIAKWEESYGDDIEKWAEQFEKSAEEWAEKVEEKYSDDENGNTIIYNSSNHDKIKKKIIIRMPKGTKTEVNVRYGELKMADAYNVKATLNYASFIANSIDGGKSLINASYAPISVNNWINGDLQLKYVDDCKLNNVKTINLHANTSNVKINVLEENGFLSGSFGTLFINKVSNDFEAVDIVLENTDATIKIPSTAFSFHYNGKKSNLNATSSLELDKTTNGDRVLEKGYNNSPNSDKLFTIHATYSNVMTK
ncbi:MAG: hypothetical protein KUG68_07965 [Flavobacteriaceae bacterium]|nr:hypothetical protein [Flavobacteriaceae bacterium]